MGVKVTAGHEISFIAVGGRRTGAEGAEEESSAFRGNPVVVFVETKMPPRLLLACR